jgi:ribosomal protein L34E
VTAHKLVCDWQGGGTPSTHRCAGCGWEVITYAKPRQATAAAVQAAYDRHLDPQTGLFAMPRTNTPDVITAKPGPNGTISRTRKVRVKRCCDGCGEVLGDVTDAELEAAVTGRDLPSVIAEHGCQTGGD